VRGLSFSLIGLIPFTCNLSVCVYLYWFVYSSTSAGPWLAYWLMLGSALTNIGMFEAEMSSDAWQVAGMADRGILPSVLGTRNRFDTPTYGILLSAAGVTIMSCFSFTQVVDMLNLLFCFGQAIEFCAFLHLRRVQPDMPRPFKIPIGFVGMCVVMSVPMAFIFVIMYFSSWISLVITIALAIIGVFLFYLLKIAKDRGWCDFDDRCAAEYVASPSVKNSQSGLGS
jgi:amino acid transporter